jgi:hypothetical protein
MITDKIPQTLPTELKFGSIVPLLYFIKAELGLGVGYQSSVIIYP